MLDDYLKREDVKRFINIIKNNERYFMKENLNIACKYFVQDYLALFIFYDALVKYKIIIDDVNLFEEFLEQLDKIYKKIDNFDEIRVGINKLIGKMVLNKLEIKNVISDLQKKQVISYVYNKYILDGYYIHGFNSYYCENIQNNGFIPEKYVNNYNEFIKIKNIFSKHNAINIISKDFSLKKVDYTDDIVMACYYSKYSPLFFYDFLNSKDYFGKEIKIDNSLKDNISSWTKNLKMFMYNSFFSDGDKNFINNVVKNKWNEIHSKDTISLLLIKRRIFSDKIIDIENYLNDKSDIYDIVDRLLSSKVGNISSNLIIPKNNLIVLNFDISNISKRIDEDSENLNIIKNKKFLDVYGKASIFIILGSLLISLGVIIMIFMVLRGI